MIREHGENVMLSLGQNEIAEGIANMEMLYERLLELNPGLSRSRREDLRHDFEVAETAMKMVWLTFHEKRTKLDGWIPYPMFSPKPETPVDITYRRKGWKAGKWLYYTARAVYEDGSVAAGDSRFNWDECMELDYDEERDEYLIPKGWWESVSFNDHFAPVDMEVVAWRPVAQPCRAFTDSLQDEDGGE